MLSDGSCGEDHGMVGSGSVPMDERTCLLGQCTTEERLACRQRLRRYAAMQQNDMDAPQDEEAQDSAAALREEYQSTHHLLLLLLLTVSMFVVSPHTRNLEHFFLYSFLGVPELSSDV